MKNQISIYCTFVLALFCVPNFIFGDETTYNPEGEMNAAWVASVSNINWPSKTGLSVESQKAEAIAILDKAKSLGMNMIVLQVRPCGDAFYKSSYYPWSQYLSGTQGNDPGYDPLEFWIEESHKRGMAIHAWINPYRLSTKGGGEKADLSLFSDDHPAKKHPDWVVPYADGKIYFNPGIPECREHVVDAALEIVRKYDIDGLHMDDYFYPYPQTTTNPDGTRSPAVFDDSAQFEKYGKDFVRKSKLEDKTETEQLEHWRRNNVNLMVKDIHDGIRESGTEKRVRFGISPFGIWRNKRTDPSGSDTRGLQSYDAIYADSKHWIENGYVDYIVPQLYWHIGFEVADYKELSRWWSELAKANPGVDLYIGMAAHRVGGHAGTPWAEGSSELGRQLEMNANNPAIKGQFYFGWPMIASNKTGVADLIKAHIEGKTVTVNKTRSFKKGSVSVYLNPSLQPRNIGFGDYGTEEDRMHELSSHVENALLAHGVTVYRNRIGMTLDQSIADSNSKKPDVHIALHSNAFNKNVRGVETFHKNKGENFEECKRFATVVYEGLLEIYDGPRRGVKATSSLKEPRTVKAVNTLVEIAFHDNETDSKWILDNMQRIGENIADSILRYLSEKHPDALLN